MKKPKYMMIQYYKTPQAFVDKYNLTAYVYNGWVVL